MSENRGEMGIFNFTACGKMSSASPRSIKKHLRKVLENKTSNNMTLKDTCYKKSLKSEKLLIIKSVVDGFTFNIPCPPSLNTDVQSDVFK